MQVIQKSSSGTQSFPLDAMLLAQRTVTYLLVQLYQFLNLVFQ